MKDKAPQQLDTADEQPIELEQERPEMLRKLSPGERFFQDELEINSCVNSSSILFDTSLDLFAHVPLIEEAVLAWMQTQPFLRTRIVALNGDKHFAYASADALRDATKNNLTFLYYKKDDSEQQSTTTATRYDDCGDYWKLLLEKELNVPPNWELGPMWRLMFVHVKHCPDTNKNTYCLIITASHAIFDGGSAFLVLAALFEIIQAMLAKTFRCEDLPRTVEVSRCVEEQVAEYMQKHPAIGQVQTVRLDGFKRPPQFVVHDAQTERHEANPVAREDDESLRKRGRFCTLHDGKTYMSVRELVEFNRASATKMQLLVIDESRLAKVLLKARRMNVKFTSVLHLVFILAWHEIYKKLDDSMLRHLGDKIQYLTLCDLRYSMKEVSHFMLVWFCSRLMSSYDVSKVDVTDEDFWKSTFWTLAREESESLHSRLKRCEQLKEVFQTPNPLAPDQTRIHFALSNMVVPVNPNDKLLKLNEIYTLTSYRKEWTSDFCYNNTINVGNRMSWVCSYNSYFVKAETIQAFVDNALVIFDKLNENA